MSCDVEERVAVLRLGVMCACLRTARARELHALGSSGASLSGRRVYLDDWDTFYAEAEKMYVDHPAQVRKGRAADVRCHVATYPVPIRCASTDALRYEIQTLRWQDCPKSHQ